MTRKRVAIVVQRYGQEVTGGAELLARWLAERLLTLADVEILTTCALDYTTWANHYPAGETLVNGIPVHRFPVDKPRNWPKSQKRTFELISTKHSLLDELEWIQEQGPISTPLLNAIEAAYNQYDAFLFVTYVYATTYFGLPLVSDKAILIPAAHDEPYLKLPLFRPIFNLPQVVVYSTQAERQLVNAAMQNHDPVQLVIGVGVNVPDETSKERFRQQFGIEEPFLLYVGRIDRAKNVPELLDYFARFRQETDQPLKLVLIGRSNIPLLNHPDIIHLGFQSEQVKFDAIKAAEIVILPSLYESLSIIALEAWLMETPMIVNGRCEVMKQQCRHSNGGLYYHTYDEFEVILKKLLADAHLRERLGRQGRNFVAQTYHWDVVMAKYQAVLDTLF